MVIMDMHMEIHQGAAAVDCVGLWLYKKNKKHNEHESAHKQNSILTVTLAAFKRFSYE